MKRSPSIAQAAFPNGGTAPLDWSLELAAEMAALVGPNPMLHPTSVESAYRSLVARSWTVLGLGFITKPAVDLWAKQPGPQGPQPKTTAIQ
jgi:hypothetical protein